MRDVAIVGFAQAPLDQAPGQTETLMLLPTITDALAQAGMTRKDVGFTCSGSADYLTGGAFTFVQMLEAAGANSISVSGGVHASRPYMVVPGMSVERGCYVRYSEAMRQRLKVPVMTVGRITTPELAEEILERNQADYICLSRALIADPYFPAKARAGRMETIAARLIVAGAAPDTPAAAVTWGSTDRQQVVTAPLSTIAAAITAAGIGAPAVIVVGEVAALHQELAWFQPAGDAAGFLDLHPAPAPVPAPVRYGT